VRYGDDAFIIFLVLSLLAVGRRRLHP